MKTGGKDNSSELLNERKSIRSTQRAYGKCYTKNLPVRLRPVRLETEERLPAHIFGKRAQKEQDWVTVKTIEHEYL